MKELRAAKGGAVRVLLWFHPRRQRSCCDVRVSTLPLHLEARRPPRARGRVRRRGPSGADHTSAATTPPDRSLSAPCQHDSRPPVQMSVVAPLGCRLVQQSYNTTSTNGLLLAPTTALLGGADSLVQQGKRRRAPTSSHGRRCTHNPKVAGSNPAPATNWKHQLRGPFRIAGKGLWRCNPPVRTTSVQQI